MAGAFLWFVVGFLTCVGVVEVAFLLAKAPHGDEQNGESDLPIDDQDHPIQSSAW